jgi:8-oxo-dGTP diphosphatase
VDPAQVKPQAADDAEAVSWFPLDELPSLAFDHAMILDKARARLSTTGHSET